MLPHLHRRTMAWVEKLEDFHYAPRVQQSLEHHLEEVEFELCCRTRIYRLLVHAVVFNTEHLQVTF